MRSVRARLVPALALFLLTAPAFPATKIVEVGPENTLTFRDQESGSDTTTVMVGDTVDWRWMSSGHSTTRTDSPESWDSGVQAAPFTFSHTFRTPGTFPYHCTPHEFLGMTGSVVVLAGGPTTTTTLPPAGCTDAHALLLTRAEIDAQCDCAGARKHGAYVKCAATMAKTAVRSGTLSKACKGAVKRCAAQSTCGRPGFVTCCRTNAQGVQKCSIKRSAAACKPPKGGTACVGDRPSCCDACGGATCPPPATTTSTTLRPTTTTRVPGGNPSAPTTSTTLPQPQCLVDADCQGANLCDGLQGCVGGVCVVGMPGLCPDDTPALWLGTASDLAGFIDIAITLCPADALVSGVLFCLPGSAPCFGVESAIFGTTFVGVDGITVIFDPIIFADGGSCTFDGLLFGFTMGGNFLCVDPFGFTVSTGTWSASRCP